MQAFVRRLLNNASFDVPAALSFRLNRPASWERGRPLREGSTLLMLQSI